MRRRRAAASVATYSSLPITMRVGPAAVQQRREGRARLGPERGGPHRAAHRERDVGAGERLELRGAPIVEQVPTVKRPSTSGRSRPIVTGTLTTSSTPRGCSQNAGVTLPSTASGGVFGAVRDRPRHGFADERELFAAPSGDDQQVRAGLLR